MVEEAGVALRSYIDAPWEEVVVPERHIEDYRGQIGNDNTSLSRTSSVGEMFSGDA